MKSVEELIKNPEPIVVAMALSLYLYNVDSHTIAVKIFEHFDGACMDVDELIDILVERRGFEATELPVQTAEFLVECAMEKYGDEAAERVKLERLIPREFLEKIK